MRDDTLMLRNQRKWPGGKALLYLAGRRILEHHGIHAPGKRHQRSKHDASL